MGESIEVIVRFSFPYYRFCKRIVQNSQEISQPFPTQEQISQYIDKITPILKEYENTITSKITEITHLEWQESKVVCYVVGADRSFSDPLTMKMFNDPTRFVDILTHELIHQIFIQNRDKLQQAWQYIRSDAYSEETRITQNHIPLHAIHSIIYLELFDESRLQRDIEICQSKPAYKKSWEIVERVGPHNIINEFTSRIESVQSIEPQRRRN